MFFRKLSIILSVTLLIFSININLVSALNDENPTSVYQEIVRDIGIVDNEMSLLIKSISSKNPNKDDLQNQIKHIDTLIDDLNKKSSQLPKEHKNVSVSVSTILGLYQLALIGSESYLRTSYSEELVDSISYFSTGYYSLTNLRNIIYQAAK
ncbi:hypothetical protein [Paraclostridium bifermentans]|uniref:hypothetical protein n=1 Tax=Paraclostridium bifermentans TaxID=1490 RepID=UPI0011DDE991|nr:hypothetical protein [Paraclostridium bifermentans]